MSTKQHEKTYTEKETEIIPTLLFEVNYPNIFAVTEAGHVVKVEVTDKQKKDPLFWNILDKIKNAKIWVPLSKMQHQLYDNDWFALD
ncbi:hypothetical protein ACFQ5M_04755 [Agrilactobacillus yilanensis]|uniref:DUF2442 domain-containing protein n=1 Tax=Agrilactobacillus yilanensis TaxID=2485997 RepID=A0ABW4J627_9LACO|nr:hypothetical protein [Agrilactobacillus yilanensis]